MQVKEFIAYCLVVEEAGHQLEQRALAGYAMPKVLATPFGTLCSQDELGVEAPMKSYPGRPRPDLPNLFRLRGGKTASGIILIPSLSPLRFLILQMCIGARTGELVQARYNPGGPKRSRAKKRSSF